VERFRIALENRGVRASRLMLYGSYAKGTWREGSDIDVVVVSDDFVGKTYWERIELLAKAVCEVWEPIEAVAMTSEEWEHGDSMIAEFARDGELLYPAGPE
jgi:predicted nucleotidyltransferase